MIDHFSNSSPSSKNSDLSGCEKPDSIENNLTLPKTENPRLFNCDIEADLQELQRLQSRESHSIISLDEQDRLARVLMGKRSINPNEPVPLIGAGRSYPPIVPDEKSYEVDFDSPDDPIHPHNWPLKEKLVIATPLALCALTTTWGSSIFSVVTSVLSQNYKVKLVVIELGVSFYVLGFASGPIIWSPLSEVYGRKPSLVISMFLFSCFVFATATAKDLQTILICRFFCRLTGSSPLTVVGAVFADMFPLKSRGKAIDIFCATVFCGPLIAPIVGGFIVESYLGWRWTMYLTGIMGSCAFLGTVFFVKETYAPLILVAKAEKIRFLTGNWTIHAAHERVKLDLSEIITKTIVRPLKMLFTEPILFMISLYNGFCYAILYLCLSSYPYAFINKYKWKLSHAMLPYLAVLIGMLVCGGVMMTVYEESYFKQVKANGGHAVPEARLAPMKPSAISFAAGIFLFFWSANYPQHVHWAIPTVSGLFFGYGLMGILVPSMNYVVDTYMLFAASALAALTFLRSALGASSPLFATYMFEGIGLNWSGLVIGLVAVALAPVPFLFSTFGKRLRSISKFALKE